MTGAGTNVNVPTRHICEWYLPHIMNRRTVLGVSAALSTSLGGCLSHPFGGCPPTGNIEVYLVTDVPNNTAVLDAGADNLTDSEYISQALVKADQADKTELRNELEDSSDETTNQSSAAPTAGELNESDDGYMDGHHARQNGARVARIRSEEMASTDGVSDILDAPDGTYVRYKNTIYVLFYSEYVC